MSVTTETLRILSSMRVELSARVDAETRALTKAWFRAWNEVAPEWEAALADLVAASRDGEWPTRAQISRAKRAIRALEATQSAIADLADSQNLRITAELPKLAKAARRWEADLLRSQLPSDIPAGHVLLGADFDRVSDRAIDAIVRRSTRRVTSLTRPLSADATAAMKATLIRGIALGENPNRAASRMVARVRGDFEGGLARAKVIARTEMLDAHREASRAQDRANADILTGWQWVAQLDKRTCPSCWSHHGDIYPVDEPGPLDHQQGRCARSPVTKSWRELGFAIPEPASVLADAQATFKALPRDDQIAILGAQRLDLLDKGKIGWGDLSQRRTTDGWRDSYAPTPIKDLVAKARRAA